MTCRAFLRCINIFLFCLHSNAPRLRVPSFNIEGVFSILQTVNFRCVIYGNFVKRIFYSFLNCDALQNILKNRRGAKPITIDGYSDFLFINRNGKPKLAVGYNIMFSGLVKKYSKCRTAALPKVTTPHTLRHTFCTNKANAGMNPKALQYIMGHSNIVMTLNYYAHANFESAKAEMDRLTA